jgi:hypothetical protein
MFIIMKIILVGIWAWLIYKYGAPNEAIDKPIEYEGIPSEYFDERTSTEEEGPSGLYVAFYRTQFIILYLLTFFLFMGSKVQWITWRAWFALIIVCVVIYWNLVRDNSDREFDSIKDSLLKKILAVVFMHIILCLFIVLL